MPNEKINIVGTNIAEKATMIWNVADMLQGYKTSKGAIQLPNDRELPLELWPTSSGGALSKTPSSVSGPICRLARDLYPTLTLSDM